MLALSLNIDTAMFGSTSDAIVPTPDTVPAKGALR